MQQSSGFGSDSEKNRGVDDMAGGDSASGEKIGTFSSLRIRNFRFLIAGTTLTNAAQWVQQVTLNWLVYDITGSGTMLATVNLVRSASAMGVIPIAGILIDKMKRRTLLTANNVWLFTITVILGILLLLGYKEMTYVFIFSFLAGFVMTIDNTLRQVLVFDLVPRSHTPNGMALVQTGWSLMRSFGPAMGSFLIIWLGAGGNFLVQAGAYALIIITILQIRFPARKSGVIRNSPLANIKEGIRYIKKERVTRTFMMLGFLLPLLVIPVYTILPPIYAVEVFGDESSRVLGFLMASVGVGGIIGGFVVASLGRLERRGLLQMASLFLLSMAFIGFAFSKTLIVSLLFLALSGFFEIIFLTTNQTLLQLSIPDELRGRVTSVVNLNMALNPLGNLLAGVGSDYLGGPKNITIIMAGITAAVVIIILLCSSTVRNYRLSQAMRSS
jgi:MFS family permease